MAEQPLGGLRLVGLEVAAQAALSGFELPPQREPLRWLAAPPPPSELADAPSEGDESVYVEFDCAPAPSLAPGTSYEFTARPPARRLAPLTPRASRGWTRRRRG